MNLMTSYFEEFLRRINPSESKITQAQSEHTALRRRIEQDDDLQGWYPDTFLQGSYRKRTALYYIDDVDVIVLFKGIKLSCDGSGTISSDSIYQAIYNSLLNMSIYNGKLIPQKRSIGIKLDIKIDVTPAIAGTDGYDYDPIYIPDKTKQRFIATYPRRNILYVEEKNKNTDGNFVPLIKLFKYWRGVTFKNNEGPPSYYLESLLAEIADEKLKGAIGIAFASAVTEILDKFKPSPNLIVHGLGSGNDILVSGEWSQTEYNTFYNTLVLEVPRIRNALNATSESTAATYWQQVFGDNFPSSL